MLFIISEFIQSLGAIFSKSSKGIALLGFFVLGYLAGSPNPQHTFDYQTYSIIYNTTTSNQNFYFEKGYSEIALWFSNHGLTYEQFRLFFAFMALIILYTGLIKFTKNAAMFTFLYGGTIFFYDAVQIRNLMMISLVIFGMSFLVNFSYRNAVISFMLIVLSAQFHSIGYIFLLVVVVRIVPEKIVNRGLAVVISITFILILMIQVTGTAPIMELVSKVLRGIIGSRANLQDKILNQYSYGSPTFKLLLVIISTLSSIFVTKILMANVSNKEITQKLNVLYSGLIISVITLPLLFLALDYSRIQRNAFLFFLIGCSVYFEKRDDSEEIVKSISVGTLCLLILVTCVLCVLTQIYIWGFSFLDTVPYLMKL
ncbi:MAG: EpsG family protein [Latilactobacillus curvatus]